MKKLKLRAMELGAQEVLTRDQLKNVLGGLDASGGSCSASACDKSCSCSTDGANSCSSTSNSASCNCDGIIVEISC